MKLLDVNVLVYAHREDAPDHSDYRIWLEQLANGGEAFAIPDLVLGGFLRVVTHTRIFDPPTDLRVALRFVQTLRECANHVVISPGPGHWSIFTRLVRESSCRGNLVPDAFLAAMAIESGNTWITTDRGYGRFRDLNWRHPLDAA
ncbi:MAG: type II toxin-antitoxin system VapC family toxin [Verrucomicrobia bacterium]|nr:type II toxin-antitoxin system VapC family toxin [Verrucomicrobiota bacterium]MBV8485713.1 type II toxin-antitoxin system VapC family toxin [Verrucomicrobiota bacterium]